MSVTPTVSSDEEFSNFLNFLHTPSPPAQRDIVRDGLDGEHPENTSAIVKENRDKDVQAKGQQHDGEKYKTVKSIQRFLEEKLSMTKEMTKSEFKEFLLDQTGILANDALLGAIFDATDEDKSGFLDSGELATYIRDIKPSTQKERAKWVLRACLLSPLPYLVLFSLACGMIAASTNLRSRPGGDLYGKSTRLGLIAAICDMIGNSGYLLLKWDQEKQSYENLQAARARLIKWVHFDLPRFLDKAKTHESDSADKTPATRGSLESMEMSRNLTDDEEQKRMDKEALVSIRSLFSEDASVEPSDEGDGLDLREMRLMLETMGVFLAENALKDIFHEIDDDGGGTISISELIQYAKERQAMVSDEKKHPCLSFLSWLKILKRCCLTIGFWCGWLFLLGDVFWILYATVGTVQFLGLVCVAFLVSCLGNMTNLYQSALTVQRQVDNARMMLREAAISVGVSLMEKDNIDSPQNVPTKPTEEMRRSAHIKIKQDNEDMRNQAKQTVEEMAESVQDRIQQEAMSKLKPTQQLTKLSSMKNTKSTNTTNMEVYSVEKLAQAQQEGAVELFKIIDVSDDNDVDKNELHDALTELGVMIPTHVFDNLYKSIDESGDGILQLDEFINYVSNIKPIQSKKELILTTLKVMVMHISFFIVLTQITAALLHFIAAYWPPASPPMRESNMWLVGSLGYAIGGFYFLSQWPRQKGQFFDEVENSVFMLKAAILDQCRDFIVEEDKLAAANV